MLKAVWVGAVALLLCVVVATEKAAAQQTIELEPTAAFLAEMYQTYDNATNDANLQGELWETQLQHKLWNLFETDRARGTKKVMKKRLVIDPMTVIFAYNKHFQRIAKTPLDNTDYLQLKTMLLGDLDMMQAEAARVRGYDSKLTDEADRVVIAKAKALKDASVLVELDANNAEKPIATIKDFTDLVERTAFMYVGGVMVDQQNNNKTKKKYSIAQDKKFLLFEAVNRQVMNKMDPKRPSQYDTALVAGKLQDGKIPVLLGASRVSVANSDDYEDKKARDSHGGL